MKDTQFNTAVASAPSVPRSMTTFDTMPAMVLQYVPDLGSGGSTAQILLTQAAGGSTLTFLVDSASATGDDAIGGYGYANGPAGADANHAGLFNLGSASCDSLGELVDAINGSKAWRAYLVAGLRSDGCGKLLDVGSLASVIGDNGYTLYFDSTSLSACGVAISGEKFVNNGVSGHVKDADDGVVNICQHVTLNLGIPGTTTGGLNRLKFYTEKQLEGPSSTLSSFSITDDTEATYGEESVDEPFVMAPIGQRLIVRAERASDTTALDAHTLFETLGKSAVLRGNRLVNEKNW